MEALHSKKPLESNVEIRENVCTSYEPRMLTVHHPNLKESQSKRVRKRGHGFRREEAGGEKGRGKRYEERGETEEREREGGRWREGKEREYRRDIIDKD